MISQLISKEDLEIGVAAMRRSLNVLLLIGAVGAAGAGITAATINAPHPISTVSDVVPAFSAAQAATDKIPSSVVAAFTGTGADLASARLLGSGANAKY